MTRSYIFVVLTLCIFIIIISATIAGIERHHTTKNAKIKAQGKTWCYADWLCADINFPADPTSDADFYLSKVYSPVLDAIPMWYACRMDNFTTEQVFVHPETGVRYFIPNPTAVSTATDGCIASDPCLKTVTGTDSNGKSYTYLEYDFTNAACPVAIAADSQTYGGDANTHGSILNWFANTSNKRVPDQVNTQIFTSDAITKWGGTIGFNYGSTCACPIQYFNDMVVDLAGSNSSNVSLEFGNTAPSSTAVDATTLGSTYLRLVPNVPVYISTSDGLLFPSEGSDRVLVSSDLSKTTLTAPSEQISRYVQDYSMSGLYICDDYYNNNVTNFNVPGSGTTAPVVSTGTAPGCSPETCIWYWKTCSRDNTSGDVTSSAIDLRPISQTYGVFGGELIMSDPGVVRRKGLITIKGESVYGWVKGEFAKTIGDKTSTSPSDLSISINDIQSYPYDLNYINAFAGYPNPFNGSVLDFANLTAALPDTPNVIIPTYTASGFRNQTAKIAATINL